jgi:hypothetical protein
MTAAKDDPQRWREMPGDPGALGGRAADLVDAVRAAPPLSSEALARIKGEVLARRSSRTRRGLPVSLRFALLTMVVLASVATAKGTMILWRRHVASFPAPQAPLHHSVSSARRPRPAAPQPLPPLAAPTPVPAPQATVWRPRRAALAPARPRAAEKAATPTATEAQLLARALSRLRQAHDPAGAVSLLDEYARAFPHGILETEALSARLEAVIQLDDRGTALRLLDGRSAFAGRLGAQQLLTRAELRASAGRYGDALGDFDRLLAPQGPAAPADLERALYGRAVCLGHLGRDDRARADLVTYQRRFPGGKYAAEVSRLLQGTGPEHRP